MSYIRWDKQNSWGFRQVYSLHLNIIYRDLAANCPVIHTILTEQTVQVGAVAWLLKLQSKILGDVYLLQCFPGTVTKLLILCTKQEGQEMWLLWEEKVLIREI